MRVNTNPTSLKSQRVLKKTSEASSQNFGQLSSGERISKAAIDPAGLAISEKLKAKIRSTQMAKRNTTDGLSMVQTADGSLGVMANLTMKMKELAIQSATDTLDDSERSMIDNQFQNTKDEISRVMESTNFNGMKLLNNQSESYEFQIGTESSSSNRIGYDVTNAVKGINSFNLNSNIKSKFSARSAMGEVDGFLHKINKGRSALGSIQSRMHSTSQNLWNSEVNLSAANSQIRDLDIAKGTAERAKLNIKKEAGSSVLAQANQLPENISKLI